MPNKNIFFLRLVNIYSSLSWGITEVSVIDDLSTSTGKATTTLLQNSLTRPLSGSVHWNGHSGRDVSAGARGRDYNISIQRNNISRRI